MNMVCASTYLYLLQFLSSVPYNFLRTGFLTSFLRFIPQNFILFEAIVIGIAFLISLSVSSLLAYKNATDFWILILYPVTLLNSFILVVSWWNLWGSVIILSCHLQIKMDLPFDPAIPFLGIYLKGPKTLIQKNISTPMFIAALFTISKIWKQPKCPSIDEWIK